MPQDGVQRRQVVHEAGGDLGDAVITANRTIGAVIQADGRQQTGQAGRAAAQRQRHRRGGRQEAVAVAGAIAISISTATAYRQTEAQLRREKVTAERAAVGELPLKGERRRRGQHAPIASHRTGGRGERTSAASASAVHVDGGGAATEAPGGRHSAAVLAAVGAAGGEDAKGVLVLVVAEELVADSVEHGVEGEEVRVQWHQTADVRLGHLNVAQLAGHEDRFVHLPHRLHESGNGAAGAVGAGRVLRDEGLSPGGLLGADGEDVIHLQVDRTGVWHCDAGRKWMGEKENLLW